MVLCKTIRTEPKIKYYAGVKGTDAQDAADSWKHYPRQLWNFNYTKNLKYLSG